MFNIVSVINKIKTRSKKGDKAPISVFLYPHISYVLCFLCYLT